MSMIPPIPTPNMAPPAPPATTGGGAMPTQKTPPSSVLETAHTDMIHDAQLDFDGRRLATCSSDRTVKVFQVERSGGHRLEATLEGHNGPVWQIAWAYPQRHGRPLLASASYDGHVILWIEDSPGSWRQYFDYSWHATSVNSVAFAPHEYGLAFACASSDGFVSICMQMQDGTWDEQRLSESRDGGAHTHPLGAMSVSWAPAVAPGGLWMPERAQPPPMTVVTGGCDHLVKTWALNEDTKTWHMQAKLKQHRDMVRSVAWAPNIGLPRSVIASAGQDRKVIVWSRRIESSDTEAASWDAVELPPFSAPVWSVSWSPTGSVLGIASGDNSVTLWKEELSGTWKNVSEVTSDGSGPPSKAATS